MTEKDYEEFREFSPDFSKVDTKVEA